MIMYIHGFEPRNVDYLTTNYDILPTVMSILGVKNKVSDYSFGRNILEEDIRKDVIICNWSNCAIKDPESILVFSYETHKLFNMELFDKDYNPILNEKLWVYKKERLLLLANEFKYFYK